MENDNILTFLAVIFLAGFFIILPATALNTPSQVQAESIINGNITIPAGTYAKTDQLELTIGNNKKSKAIFELLNECNNNECTEGQGYYSATGEPTTSFQDSNFLIGIPFPEDALILSEELSLKLTGNSLEPELDLGKQGTDWIYPGTPGSSFLPQVGITTIQETDKEELIIANCEKLTTPKTTEIKLNVYLKASAKPDIVVFNSDDNLIYLKECNTQPNNQYQWLSCSLKAEDLNNNAQVFDSGEYFFCLSSPAEDKIKYTQQNPSKKGYVFSLEQGFISINGDYLINIQPKEHNSILTEQTISVSNQDGTPLISKLQEYIDDCTYTDYNNGKYCIIPVKVKTKDNSSITISDLNINILTKENRGLPLNEFVTNLKEEEPAEIILSENTTIDISKVALKAPMQTQKYNLTAKIKTLEETKEVTVTYRPSLQLSQIRQKFDVAYENYQNSPLPTREVYSNLGLDKEIENSKKLLENYEANPQPELEIQLNEIPEKTPNEIIISDKTTIQPLLLQSKLSSLYPKESEDTIVAIQRINEKIKQEFKASLVEAEYLTGTKKTFIVVEKTFTTEAPLEPVYVTEILPESLPSTAITPVSPQPIEKDTQTIKYKFNIINDEASIIYIIDANTLSAFPEITTILSPSPSPSEISLSIPEFDCPNSICNPGEDYLSCPEDCTCGNNRCDAGETPTTCPQDCKVFPWTPFLISISILIVVGLISIITIQPEFLKKYPFMQKIFSKIKLNQPLFSSQTEANKLINFVKSARQRKMNDKEINAALEKKGWKEKQINYAFKRAK